MNWLLLLTLITADGGSVVEMKEFQSAEDCHIVKSNFLEMRKGRYESRDARCILINKESK